MILKTQIKQRDADRQAIARDVQQFRAKGGRITEVPRIKTTTRPIGKAYGSDRMQFHV